MEGSEGLFLLTCVCDNVYDPELRKCPSCDKDTRHQKSLELDYQKFFDKVCALHEAGKKADSMDVLFDVFFNLWNRYDIMDKILVGIPLDRIGGGLMVGCMSNTFKYKDHLPNFVDFCNRVAARMREMGKDEKEIESYMRDFRDVDTKKHWADMKALGVQFPNMIFGPGPEGEQNENNKSDSDGSQDS